LVMGIKAIIVLIFLNTSTVLICQDYELLSPIACQGLIKNYQQDSLYVVTDCPISEELNWIVCWSTSNLVGLKRLNKIIFLNDYNKNLDGFIVQTRIYKSRNEEYHYAFNVFGYEDEDWSIKIFKIKDDKIDYLNELAILEKYYDFGDSNGEYTNAPFEKMQVYEDIENGLKIRFEQSEYQVYEAEKFKRVDQEVNYYLKGKYLQIEDGNDR